MMLSFFRGNIIPSEEAKVEIQSLGFSLGASVFEACRVNYNPITNIYYLFRIKDHIARFFNSMKILRMTSPYTPEELLKMVTTLIQKWEGKADGYIKIIAYISSASRGSSVFNPLDVETDICIMVSPSPWKGDVGRSINVCVSSWQKIQDTCMPPRVKSVCNYENSRLAGYEAVLNGYDNAILLNQYGKVSEAAESTVFIVRNGTLITPNCSSDILGGITRDTVINYCANEAGLAIVERTVDRSELYISDEIFVCNTAKLIRPVLSVDKIRIGEGKRGDITQKMQESYKLIAYGNGNRYRKRSIVI